MFNLFPLFGTSDDSTSSKDFMIKQPWPNWSYTTATIKDKDGKDVSVQELIEKFNRLSESVEHLRGEAEKFYEENKKLKDQLNSIEEDGTEEHNAAVKLRQENAQLKVEIERLQKFENWHQPQLCSEQISELMKEVNGLRHLKEENVELLERINEIDSDVNKEYQAEIFTLKNECALLRSKNNTLQEFIDTKIKVDWKSARIDILERDLQKCAEQRDEYKHQLNAANKEIGQLKRWKKEQLTVQSWWDKVDSYVRDHDDAPLGGFTANTCLNFLKERDRQKEEIAKLKQDIVDYVIEKDDKIEQLQKELNHMKAVAEGAISLCDLSDKTDYDLATNEIKKTQDWKELKAREEKRYFVCNHCGYRVSHDTNYWGGCGFCKEGLMIEKEVEEQKHPMYPLHWGGLDPDILKQAKEQNIEEIVEALKGIKTQGFEDYDLRDFVESEIKNQDPLEGKQVKDTWCYKCQYIKEQCKCNEEVEFNSEELLKRVTEYADTLNDLPKSFPNEFQNGKTTAENLEEKFDKGEDVIDYFQPYHCPCNMCKHAREENTEKSWEEAASDLALRVIKLEKQIEELKIINICQKQS
jgi:hypothetical protein